MLEIPEAVTMARQLRDTVRGKRVAKALAASSPHKFAWFTGDPAEYPARLCGKPVLDAVPVAGRVELTVGDYRLHIGEGAKLRYLAPGGAVPAKHQLLVVFEDASALVGTVSMYGMFMCFRPGEMDGDKYYAGGEGGRFAAVGRV